MACERGPNRVSAIASRIGAGMARLANKRGFYAGLALGGAGLVGAGLVALARRQSSRGNETREQATITMQPIPQLPERTRLQPTTHLTSSDRCAGCQVSARRKPGAWYTVNNRTYCPDCAPEAAQQANVDLAAPAAAAGEATAAYGPPETRRSYLSPERRVETRLEPTRIRVNVGQSPGGQPAWVVVNQGYALVRPNGWDTGLALTPGLRRGRDGHSIEEDTGQWWLTHISSGRRLGDQPYANPAEAQALGSVLAQVDWTRPAEEISDGDIERAWHTIRRFNQALAVEKYQPAPATTITPPPATRPASQTGQAKVSLVGKLVADGYGGVARVLEEEGDRLFMVDSVGTRYEVSRNEVRAPSEQDFELCRVAMSFDPAQEPKAKCTGCGRSTGQTGAGEMWYKMGWQAFCETCASRYAAEEGYLKDEEVNADLEPMLG